MRKQVPRSRRPNQERRMLRRQVLRPLRRRRAHAGLRPLRPAVHHLQRQRLVHRGHLHALVQPSVLGLQRDVAHQHAQPQRAHLRRHDGQPALLRRVQQPLPVRRLRRDDVRAIRQRRQRDGGELQGHVLAVVPDAVRDDRQLQREQRQAASHQQLRQHQPGRQQLRRGKI